MPLKAGMSFLNIGSGTGYFSCLVAEVVGECGVNDGLELWPENVSHAQERCASLGKHHIEFNVGNVYQLDVNLGMRYDRIYIGACACPRAQYLYSLLEVGGVLVGPFQSGHSQQLRRVVRESEAHFKIEVLNSVHFASLVEPPATQEISDLDAPAPLGVLPVVGLPGVPFSFALRQKPWSVERNWAYPRSFRQVAAVLMQNQASGLGLVPLELWVEHILPWCPRWWFDVPGKRANSKSGTLAILAAASRSMSKAFFSSSTCSTRSASSFDEAEGTFSGDEVNITTNDEVPLVQPARRQQSFCRAAQRAVRRCIRCLSRLGDPSHRSDLAAPLPESRSPGLAWPGPPKLTPKLTDAIMMPVATRCAKATGSGGSDVADMSLTGPRCAFSGCSAAEFTDSVLENGKAGKLQVAIIYYSVAGGPFGTEDVISAAGPLLGVLGFVLMPAVWSVPEALVAAELATAFPSNAGYVTWVTAAFGPFWGFLEGFLSWVSGVSDNSIYPVLFCDYLKHILPAAADGTPRILCALTFTLALSWLNFIGLDIMGWSAVGLAIFTILPFLYIVLAGLPEVQLANLLVVPKLQEMDWQKYLNVLFWNLNYWDSASTLAGEVRDPRRVFPQALFIAMMIVISSYVFPLFVGVGIQTSMVKLRWRNWQSGTLTLVGEATGGALVKSWVVLSAAVSNIGQFTCEQAANAYQLEGMAELGWLPTCFTRRSRYNTPYVGLGTGLVVILALSTSDFISIVDLLNGIYCQAQLLEFLAFLRLRRASPNLRRPFRVPLDSMSGCIALLFLPIVFCLLLLALPLIKGNWNQVFCLVTVPVAGLILHMALALSRRRGWLIFTREPPRTVEELLAMQTPMSTCARSHHEPFLADTFHLPPATESDEHL
ncbi:PUT1 [Symbiodinium natans]|uniref:PUT1 protein n=1 Tax=Symbiodinium natans TaxID=878477 RepID=A0A812L4G4_9DINO|nr:PUT1 [Symbiodinium natans]